MDVIIARVFSDRWM